MKTVKNNLTTRVTTRADWSTGYSEARRVRYIEQKLRASKKITAPYKGAWVHICTNRGLLMQAACVSDNQMDILAEGQRIVRPRSNFNRSSVIC